MLTLYYRNPLNGVRRAGLLRESWTIEKIEAPLLTPGAPPPDPVLVQSCHKAMRDQAGKIVPIAELERHDVREGLRAAFRSVDPDIRLAPPVPMKRKA